MVAVVVFVVCDTRIGPNETKTERRTATNLLRGSLATFSVLFLWWAPPPLLLTYDEIGNSTADKL